MERLKSMLGNQAAQGLVLAVVVFVVANWLGHVGLGLLKRWAQPNRDERTFGIHLKASAASLSVVCFLAIGAFFVDLAHGNTTVTPWVAMSAVAGLSYLLAALFFHSARLKVCRRLPSYP